MTNTTDDIAEEISFQSLDDDCRLLGSLINDVLQREVGPQVMEKIEKIRILAQVREITAIWRAVMSSSATSPLQRDEARADVCLHTRGLHIVEQSLWRRCPLSAACRNALKKVSHSFGVVFHSALSFFFSNTGKPLPLTCTPIKFGSWMGGDRDGNSNVTAKITKDVSLLSRWMAIDLYIREVDSLKFELSMKKCTDSLARLAHEILQKGGLRVKDFDIRREAGGSVNRVVQRLYQVWVSENFLEIHLFLAGKGTYTIPVRGYYGPSISAISVTPGK
ncbi:hypothetical protein IFM89_024219 [Coptis chinensis]|uniref:Malectin domain-containing protein n=1 Tax=Coptis chinensis TaxID=261450 RepID=A0A835H4Z5_9MAGN|nr:hypothetical protein IFM89_024219 [Coptis chinensis]